MDDVWVREEAILLTGLPNLLMAEGCCCLEKFLRQLQVCSCQSSTIRQEEATPDTLQEHPAVQYLVGAKQLQAPLCKRFASHQSRTLELQHAYNMWQQQPQSCF